MMKSLLLLLLVVVFINVVIGGPTRPAIPDQFYSEVHVALNSNGRFLAGGGILSYDVPKNVGRQDFKLLNDQHEVEFLHILERYDLHEVFEVFDNVKCYTQPTQGNIVSPFAWVQKASFNGSEEFQNKLHDVWVLSTVEGDNTIEYKLFVDDSDVNTPVYFTTHNISSNKVVVDVAITFLSFKAEEPQSWVFTIPHTCNSSSAGFSAAQASCGNTAYFANTNWNCGDPVCSYRVPSGSYQPGYACAEFAARSLAAGGFINLATTASQGAYSNYEGYNLLYVGGINSFAGASGWSNRGTNAGAVNAAYPVLGDGGEGAWSHACIGVAGGTVDCHNIARQGKGAQWEFPGGIDAIWAPPGC